MGLKWLRGGVIITDFFFDFFFYIFVFRRVRQISNEGPFKYNVLTCTNPFHMQSLVDLLQELNTPPSSDSGNPRLAMNAGP